MPHPTFISLLNQLKFHSLSLKLLPCIYHQLLWVSFIPYTWLTNPYCRYIYVSTHNCTSSADQLEENTLLLTNVTLISWLYSEDCYFLISMPLDDYFTHSLSSPKPSPHAHPQLKILFSTSLPHVSNTTFTQGSLHLHNVFCLPPPSLMLYYKWPRS